MKTTQTRVTTFSEERAQSRQVLECAGRAQRRRRFRTRNESGVALRLPPQSKRPGHGQPCRLETKSRNSRTRLSALLLSLAVLTTITLFLHSPPSAHAQGGVPLWTNRYSCDCLASIAADSSGNVAPVRCTTCRAWSPVSMLIPITSAPALWN